MMLFDRYTGKTVSEKEIPNQIDLANTVLLTMEKTLLTPTFQPIRQLNKICFWTRTKAFRIF